MQPEWSRAALCSSSAERPVTGTLISSFRGSAVLEEDVDEHQHDGDAEDHRADDVHLGRNAALRLAPDVERERLRRARVEARDHEVVDRQGEGEQRAGEDPRRDQRQRDRKNVTYSFAPRSIAASSTCRSKPTSRARTVTTTKLMQNMMCASTIVQKPRAVPRFRKGEERGAEHDLGRGQRHEDEQVRRAPSPEVVADEGQRDQRAEDDRDERGEQGDLDARSHRVAEEGRTEQVRPVRRGEALPGVVKRPDGSLKEKTITTTIGSIR